MAHSNPGGVNKLEANFRSYGGTNPNLPFKDEFWDVESFENKEFFFTISSMCSGHFGLTRWSLVLRETKSNCWVQTKSPLTNTLNIPNHTVPKGYDLNTINFDFLIIVSVFEHSEANLYIVDASTMAPMTSRPFPALVGKGTGRLDTHFDDYYKYRATTCIINTGNLLCETINYLTGASISSKSVADTSSGIYDPPLCSTPENKFYIVATKLKFYFFDPDNVTPNATKDLVLLAGFDIQDMNSYYGSNEIFVLTKNQLYAGYFKDVNQSPLLHPHCTGPAENGDPPVQVQLTEGLAFSRLCTVCQSTNINKFEEFKNSVSLIPSDDGSAGDGLFCVKQVMGGIVPTNPGPVRSPTFNFSGMQWQENSFEEKCGTIPQPPVTTPVVANPPPPVVTAPVIVVVQPTGGEEDKLLGMNKMVLYVVVGVLAGLVITTIISIIYCMVKSKAAAATTLKTTQVNHIHTFDQFAGSQYPYDNQHQQYNNRQNQFKDMIDESREGFYNDQDLRRTRGYDVNAFNSGFDQPRNSGYMY